MDFLVWFGGVLLCILSSHHGANALFFRRCFGDGKCLPNMVSLIYGLLDLVVDFQIKLQCQISKQISACPPSCSLFPAKTP